MYQFRGVFRGIIISRREVGGKDLGHAKEIIHLLIWLGATCALIRKGGGDKNKPVKRGQKQHYNTINEIIYVNILGGMCYFFHAKYS